MLPVEMRRVWRVAQQANTGLYKVIVLADDETLLRICLLDQVSIRRRVTARQIHRVDGVKPLCHQPVR